MAGGKICIYHPFAALATEQP
ncbi:hypothetical protein RSAG8_13392, partial [Rhizoctonia solani AG-8 WAC10335]